MEKLIKRSHCVSEPEGQPPWKRLEVDKPPTFVLLNKQNRARRGRLTLPHGIVETPAFMPVGTHGTIKMIPMEVVGRR